MSSTGYRSVGFRTSSLGTFKMPFFHFRQRQRLETYSKLATTCLLMFLVLINFGPTNAMPRKVVGLDVTYRTIDGQKGYRVKDIELDSFRMLVELERSLESWGCEVRRLNGLTRNSLLGVDAVVLGKLRDPSWRYEPAEIEAIGEWFRQGGKFLWAGGDGDHVEPYYIAAQGDFKQREPNKVLEAVSSSLRLEFCSVEDAVGAGAIDKPDRVCAMDTLDGVNAAGYASLITRGASKVLFHGPTAIIGFRAGKYVSIEEVLDQSTLWLYRTSPQATIVDHDAFPPVVLRVRQSGRFVLGAAQVVRVGDGFSKVIVTGESILGDYSIFSAGYRDVALSGPIFVRNAFAWGLEAEHHAVSRTISTTTEISPSTIETAVTMLGPVALPLAGMTAILVIGLLIYVGKKGKVARPEHKETLKDEAPSMTILGPPSSRSELYKKYLERLEELKVKKKISEQVYAKLREEYQKRQREQGSP